MRFFLGTDQPVWLERAERPLFLSWNSVARSRHTAQVDWALDSGGFTQIVRHGSYETDPETYARGVARLLSDVGRLQFAVVQDFPCAPLAMEMTGLTPSDHRRLTIESTLTLSTIAPELPWAPVLTGVTPSDFLRHADEYDRAGVDLGTFSAISVGALVGRSYADQLAVLEAVNTLGLPLHGLGIKGRTLRATFPMLQSADSMAWSMTARRADGPLCRPDATHQRCKGCLIYAQRWAQKLEDSLERDSFQPSLFPTFDTSKNNLC